MPSIPKISAYQKNLDSLTNTIKKMESRAAQNSKAVEKLTKELEKVNKHNEELKAEKIAQENRDPYPVVEYSDNEMTFSELMMRKLDII